MAANSKSKLRGGVDLGGTKIAVIVVDDSNKILGSSRRPTPTKGKPVDVADAIAAAVEEACTDTQVKAKDLVGIGVGSPGGVDRKAGTVTAAGNLPGWSGTYELGPELKKRLGADVTIGNDVQVATRAEMELGAGRGRDSMLTVFWGTGVGGGLVLGGVPWRGRGGAGEIGHAVINDGGRKCGCGNRGCVEAYSGRAALERHARNEIENGDKSDLLKIMKERGRERFTSSVWWHAVSRGDKLATELIDGAVEALAAGIASVCNVLDLELVLIGGGLGTRFGEDYVKKVRKAMDEHLFPGHRPPEVALVGLGDEGGALGAALLVGER